MYEGFNCLEKDVSSSQVIVREEQAVIHNEALKAQGERSKS